MLDTGFAAGADFFDTWQAWRNDSLRPRMLHYVALCEQAPAASALHDLCRLQPDRTTLAAELLPHWWGLTSGFHRLLLDQGQVILTLCVGAIDALLRQQQFLADTLYLRQGVCQRTDATQRVWLARALARCCRRGSLLHLDSVLCAATSPWRNVLMQCGFELAGTDACANDEPQHSLARYAPNWHIKTSRRPGLDAPLPLRRCAVVGAGLAGAGVAAALARRGWQVSVLDMAESAAAGASGLPVGLVFPHVSSDDCHLSRLSRAGVRLMLQHARALLRPGQDWGASGVLERQTHGKPQVPKDWPADASVWSWPADADAQTQAGVPNAPALWHASAAWIRPARLIQAWLAQPGVRFQGGARVTRLRRCTAGWELLDPHGQPLCQAEQVVLANACAMQELLADLAQGDADWAARLQRMPACHGMRGLLSWAAHADTDPQVVFPSVPVNGAGSVIAQVPHAGSPAWFVGSSYQPQAQPERSDADNHARNLAHLEQLLPELAQALAPAWADKRLQSWKASRCVSADRLPLVGALQADATAGLWLCSALGSRGLSLSVLCAELLAAQMQAEPWPVEAELARALQALRA